MTLDETIDYIQSKNNQITVESFSKFDIHGTACVFNKLPICVCYSNGEIVFYKNIVFNHNVSTTYTGNWNCSYITHDKIDEMYDKFMRTYGEATKDLKDIIVDENLEDIKKDFR